MKRDDADNKLQVMSISMATGLKTIGRQVMMQARGQGWCKRVYVLVSTCFSMETRKIQGDDASEKADASVKSRIFWHTKVRKFSLE